MNHSQTGIGSLSVLSRARGYDESCMSRVAAVGSTETGSRSGQAVSREASSDTHLAMSDVKDTQMNEQVDEVSPL